MPVKAKRVRFRSSDGILLHGILASPDSEVKGAVILAHGITGEKEEGGFYRRLARLLAKNGLMSLRFDFRGHAQSSGKSWEMTIKGELRDMAAAVKLLRSRKKGKIAIVGYSFGSGIAVLFSKKKPSMISSLVLLSPVLDYRRTFLEPEEKRAKKWFTKEALAEAEKTGKFNLADFVLGHGLIREFNRHNPGQTLLEMDVPVLVAHGTEDDLVPYSVARHYGRKYHNGKFLSVKGAQHSLAKHEKEVFPEILDWILQHMEE